MTKPTVRTGPSPSDCLWVALDRLSNDRKELCTFECVSTSWRDTIRGKIKELHTAAKFPEIETGIYSGRDYYILEKTCPQDIQGIYSKYIADAVGPTAVIASHQMKELSKWDSDHPGKRKCETHRASIRFKEVKRTFGEGEKATLDENKKLTIENVPSKRKVELTIPMSLVNVIELFNHPKAGKDKLALFCHVRSEVYKQHTACPEASSIVFVACEIPESVIGLTLDEQQRRLPGIQVAGLANLSIPHGFDYLADTKCPHSEPHKHSNNLAITSDTMKANSKEFPLALSGYAPRVFLAIYRQDFDCKTLGAVPMIPQT